MRGGECALNSPVEASDRIASLDVLRGFAVLGILVMNIQAFAMPMAAYFNPTAYGDLSGINFFTWLVSYLFVDQKFLSLFSLLFGAGIMLLGMACYRLQILSAVRSDVFYRYLALIGFGVGVPVVAVGAWWNFAVGWSWERSMFLGSQFNYWGSLAMAFGYVGLAMLAVRRGWFAALQMRLAAAGRMAFTNYIAQTLICTTIFYGHGFGLFGSVDRWQQAIVVIAVWGIQLWWSPLLLRRFRYGPLEWSWRALTYWRIPRG